MIQLTDLTQCNFLQSNHRMKRFAQLVAVLAIALFAIQPALAGMSCMPNQSAACVPGCPMAMDSMGADCPVAGQAMASECLPNCCTHGVSPAIAPLVPSERLRLAMFLISAARPDAGQSAKTAASFFAPIESRAVSPPRYILNQVFRI